MNTQPGPMRSVSSPTTRNPSGCRAKDPSMSMLKTRPCFSTGTNSWRTVTQMVVKTRRPTPMRTMRTMRTPATGACVVFAVHKVCDATNVVAYRAHTQGA
jgi:predicted secreted protein